MNYTRKFNVVLRRTLKIEAKFLSAMLLDKLGSRLDLFPGSVRCFAVSIGFGKVVPLPRGYKRPTRRVMKSPTRFPNVKTRPDEHNLVPSANGTFNMIPPYPPRVNRSIEVTPRKGDKRNHWPTQDHKDYPLRWKNVEYKYTPVLRMTPHGGDRWTGKIERVVSDSK